jgi:metallo-beta-lactamase family protein
VSTLTFLGAAGTVTGSRFLLEHQGRRVLFDCGLFQGLKALRLRNWEAFPVAPTSLDAIVLTHAHLDHVGYLPRLVREGYTGPVFCTAGTAELCRLVLPDAARIQEEDASYANRKGFSKHHPALPLYTEADAWRALSQFRTIAHHQRMYVTPDLEIELLRAGHLLGSAFVIARLAGGLSVLFGGDLGRYGRPVLPDPDDAVTADVALVESTYGNRDHAADDGGDELARVIRETARRQGKIIIPAFAIGRVEEVLYWIRRLEEQRRIPVLPVCLDSPMAGEALRYYARRLEELDPDIRPAHRNVAAFSTTRFRVIASPQQSKELTASRGPSIVVASSGMATGGRVLHHLAQALPDATNTILFVGYQAAGTRGRALVDGCAEVKIHGRMVPVAARVAQLDSMSAHADRGEILRWLRTTPQAPGAIWLVHGEPPAALALQHLLEQQLQVSVGIARDRQRLELPGHVPLGGPVVAMPSIDGT